MAENNDSALPEIIGAGIAYKTFDKYKYLSTLYSTLPGSSNLQKQYERSGLSIDRYGQSVSSSLVSQVMALEEASPLHIMRTFQLSNLLQPFIKNAALDQEVHLTGETIRGQQLFYENLLIEANKERYRKAKRLMQAEDLKRGFIFRNNKLYGVHANGSINIDDIVLDDARLVLANHKNGQIVSQNHVLRKYAEGIGANINFKNAIDNPLMVMGSNSKSKTLLSQLNSYLKVGTEIGYKTLDNPIKGFEEIVTGLGGNLYGLDNTRFWNKARAVANIQLGTGGVYHLGHADSITRMSKNLLLKGGGIYLGYQLADSAARAIASPGNDFDSGLISGLGGLYAKARIGFAKVWSDRFQNYREAQEQSAPGSTNLLTLAGMPLGGALVGAQLSYFGRIGEGIIKGQEKTAFKYSAESYSKFIGMFNIHKPTTIMQRNAIIGGIVGAATVLPFLPGALIGASSKELEDRYSGKKEDAVKANRWWGFGGNSIHGDNTKYFQQNWFARAKAQSKTKALYGDDSTEKALNPFLHLFSYLRDPYRKEKQMQDYAPYPIWGMEVGVGSFIGKFYERTIGQVIKPDLLNPKIKLEQEKTKERIDKLRGMKDVFGIKIDNEIINFRNKVLNNPEATVESSDTTDTTKESSTRLFEHNEYDPSLKPITEQVAGLKNLNNTKVVDLSNYKINVEDADTIELVKKGAFGFMSKKIQVRLAGVDAPETGDHGAGSSPKDVYHQSQEHNKESTNILKNMLANQNSLKLIVNTKDQTYGRQLGVIVGDNNSNLNMELLRQGAVTALPWDGGDIVSKPALMQAQAEARRNNAGLWQGKRYKAEQLFGEITGETQTHNTFVKLDKLSQNPALGALATYLKNLEGQQGELSADDIKNITTLANTFLNFKDDSKVDFKYQDSIALSPMKFKPGVGSVSTPLSMKPTVITSQGFGSSASYSLYNIASPDFTPNNENLKLMYDNFTDFTGIKGWAFSLAVDAVTGNNGKTLTLNDRQLSKSGEFSNPARDFAEMNLGDVAGIGEFQRRIMPTSAGALPKTTNLMQNNAAPSWLPHDGNKYYLDFSRGNYYDVVENGENRLPGKGFESLHPELKGVDPENYPLVYKYKILSDVAKGSKEQYDMRRKVLDLYKAGKLSKGEEDILVSTLDQEVARERRKTFREDIPRVSGILGTAQSSVWNTLSNISTANPFEFLTPWRPFSKFMHQRTALQDYEQTQLAGPDTAMWTNPYSHFIKPTFNKIRYMMDRGFKPEETKEKENVNEYFDKLKLIKGLLNSNEKEAYQTVVHSTLSGLNTVDKIRRFKSALTDDQKDYFESFSKETNEVTRQRILEILPDDVARGYKQIWNNVDIAEKARKGGYSVQQALNKDFLESTERLKNTFDRNYKISSEDRSRLKKRIEKDKDDYANLGYSDSLRYQLGEADLIRTRIAQKEAYQYIDKATSAPTGYFSGWDPRLTADDIKIKTLHTGKEDLRRFGFWKADEEKMNSMNVLDNDTQVVSKLEQIKQEIESARQVKTSIDVSLFKKGFKATNIRVNDSEINSVIIRNREGNK